MTHNGIQYAGLPGITESCLVAVMNLIQYDEKIERVRILSAGNEHSLLLTIHPGDLVAIKSGFASGYMGEGSRKFSYILQLLEAHKVDIDEYDVDRQILNRLDRNALTEEDIEKIETMRPVRPRRYHDYIEERHYERRKNGTLWEEFRPVVPFGIIDPRITELAISFWDDADHKLIVGYRRLEDCVRKRIGSEEHSARLFSQAFLGDSPKLRWKGLGKSEQTSRGNLFTNAYSAHRNPRAHKEHKGDPIEQLSEFLLLNHLFLLEKESEEDPRE